MKSLTTRIRVAVAFGAAVFVVLGLCGMAAGRWTQQLSLAHSASRLHDSAARLATAFDVGLWERQREVANLAESIDDLPAPVLREALVRLQRTFSSYAWVGLTDADGIVRVSSGGVLEGHDVGKRPWWLAGRDAPHVGDVHPAVLLKPFLPADPEGEPPRLLDVAAPVRIDGRFAGVVGAHLSWQWTDELRQRVSESLAPADRIQFFLLDRGGANLRLGPDGTAPQPAEALALVGQAPRVLTWSDGQRYLTAAVRRSGFKDFAGLGWTIVVRQPEHVVVAEAQPLMWAAWGISAAAAVVLAALGWALAGRALRPLHELAQRTHAQLPPAAVRPADEAEQLSQALGGLIERLRTREQDLAALNADLEARVADRTAQIESRNTELRSMARMVAHDVRAPVQSVGKLLEIALDADAPRRHEMLKAAIDECRHVGDVVEALRLMALGESGPVAQATVAMEALAAQAELRLRGAQGWRRRVVIEPLPPAHGDPVLLAAVWTNLIGNAMKFSRLAEKPEVRITGSADGGRVRYTVADNGVGFPPAQASRLFRAFERLHGDARYPGTGLGLDIVRRIVERHGGGVAADSEPGQGAVFSFWLPRHDA